MSNVICFAKSNWKSEGGVHRREPDEISPLGSGEKGPVHSGPYSRTTTPAQNSLRQQAARNIMETVKFEVGRDDNWLVGSDLYGCRHIGGKVGTVRRQDPGVDQSLPGRYRYGACSGLARISLS